MAGLGQSIALCVPSARIPPYVCLYVVLKCFGTASGPLCCILPNIVRCTHTCTALCDHPFK